MSEKPEYVGSGQWSLGGIDYAGHHVLWSFSYEPKDYLKESELSGDQWRKGGSVKIFRNGDCVFDQFCRSCEGALRYITWMLPLLQEHPVFDGDDWKAKLVGRKIYNRDVASVIVAWYEDGEILVRTEDGKPYPPWAYAKESEDQEPSEWGNQDRVSIISDKIYWYRK